MHVRSRWTGMGVSVIGLCLWTAGQLGAEEETVPAAQPEEQAGSRDVFPKDVAGNAEVERVIKTFAGRGEVGTESDPTEPEEAVKLFETADGLRMDLVAHEPAVEQPLFMHFDDRGRM